MITRRHQFPPKARSGFTLVEVAVTSLMVAITMILLVQVLSVVASERKNIDRRQCATREVANLMERLTRLPEHELGAAEISRSELSASAKANLPGADLSVKVDPSADPKGQHIRIALRWRNRAGSWEAPVRLDSWVFPRGGAR